MSFSQREEEESSFSHSVNTRKVILYQLKKGFFKKISVIKILKKVFTDYRLFTFCGKEYK